MILRLFEPFRVWARMIIDWCNTIAIDGLVNVFVCDSMAYKKLLSKKKVIKPSKKCQWVAIWKTGSGHATRKIGAVVM